jgi:hypothetical protein
MHFLKAAVDFGEGEPFENIVADEQNCKFGSISEVHPKNMFSHLPGLFRGILAGTVCESTTSDCRLRRLVVV